MGYNRTAPGITNFSAHVESLLAADRAQREARIAAERAANEHAIDAFAELYRKDGSLSEEFQEI